MNGDDEAIYVCCTQLTSRAFPLFFTAALGLRASATEFNPVAPTFVPGGAAGASADAAAGESRQLWLQEPHTPIYSFFFIMAVHLQTLPQPVLLR